MSRARDRGLRSSAVMARRREPPDSLDWFPTPPWATRAGIEALSASLPADAPMLSEMAALDPCCGDGAMARPMAEYFRFVAATDVFDYGWGHEVRDFAMPWPALDAAPWADVILMNPPFRLGLEFIHAALRRSRVACAALVRTAFLESEARWSRLYRGHPPTVVAQFCERVPMLRGRLDRGARSATAYCWLIWVHGAPTAPRLHWIPPGTRARLERDDDYPAAAGDDRRAA